MPLRMIEADVEPGRSITLERKADRRVLERLLERQDRGMHILLLLAPDKRAFARLKFPFLDDPPLGELRGLGRFFDGGRLANLRQHGPKIRPFFGAGDGGDNQKGGKGKESYDANC